MSEWADIRFADGKHTGVRVLRGTSVIEVRRDGRQVLVDISGINAVPIDSKRKQEYTNQHDKTNAARR